MGVRGLSALLQRRGLATNDFRSKHGESSNYNCENATLYRQIVPCNSTLAIDGYGLAFFLYRHTYHRHYQRIAAASANVGKGHRRCPSIACLVPTFLPTPLIQKEVRTMLQLLVQRYHMSLQVYFDGSARQMKSSTDEERRLRREKEWIELERLCRTGKLTGGSSPRSSSSGLPDPEYFLQSFPAPCLLFAIFEYEVKRWTRGTGCQGVTVVVKRCDGEADVHVAKASADDVTGSTFALGLDSDYLVFGYGDDDAAGGPVKYIPLSTLSLCQEFACLDSLPHALWATVVTRADVAEVLGLPDEAAVVELSILLGNDYTSQFVFDANRNGHKRTALPLNLSSVLQRDNFMDDSGVRGHGADDDYAEKVLSYLIHTGNGYRVATPETVENCDMSIENMTMAINFTRTLFSFGDLTMVPFDNQSNDDNDTDEEIDAIVSFKFEPSADTSACKKALVELALHPFRERLHNDGGGDDIAYPIQVSPCGEVYVQLQHLVAIEKAIHYDEDSYQALGPTRPESPNTMDWDCVLAAVGFERRLRLAISYRFEMATDNMPDVLPWIDHSKLQHLFSFPEEECLQSTAMKSTLADCDQIDAINEQKQNNSCVVPNIYPNINSRSHSPTSDSCIGNEPSAGNSVPEAPHEPRCKLPIDHHEETILKSVNDRQITIIHGETGCGKSSRVPIMLLQSPPPAIPGLSETRLVKMFVSQPRRIAARSLADRVRSSEPRFANVVALRMGHGVREYETRATRLWFVTTGYLVRLLANHPEEFRDHTHLVIDEVHERSIDTDILCFLSRRLLAHRPDIRLILMSATMAAAMYQQYFGSPTPPIHVGARRFPIQEFYVEDLEGMVHLSTKEKKIAHELYSECEKKRCRTTLSAKLVEKQHQLAAHLATTIGRHGSSVLIFVAGMSDIISITEKIEKTFVAGMACKCIPIHSEIEFEEQMSVFDDPIPGIMKIIIATNAAESSLTIPDVDHVICLGLCKGIIYDSRTHRPMLQPCWVSKASATQRAGRTGRVREGKVYRLYSRNAFEVYMDEFDLGEMTRMPLDSVVLSLRDMLTENVTTALLECIEPPDVTNIERAFESLHDSNFITLPDDQGQITALGSLAVALGIDLPLCSFVGLGVQFGVAAESIVFAAVLSFPKSPWLLANPLLQETKRYNEIAMSTFISKSHFDAHLYSDPLSVMNLIWDFNKARNKYAFCNRYSISLSRTKQLVASVKSLIQRVSKHLRVKPESLEMELPPVQMSHSKITILRILNVWVFSDCIIKQHVSGEFFRQEGSFQLNIFGDKIDSTHLYEVLDQNRHNVTIFSRQIIDHLGQFTPVLEDELVPHDFFTTFEERFVSYAIEHSCSIMFYSSKHTGLNVLFSSSFYQNNHTWIQSSDFFSGYLELLVKYHSRKETANMRGINGRSCGRWSKGEIKPLLKLDDLRPTNDDCEVYFVKVNYHSKPKTTSRKLRNLSSKIESLRVFPKSLSCVFESPKKGGRSGVEFRLRSTGFELAVSKQTLCDLFSTPRVSFTSQNLKSAHSQTLAFDRYEGKPMKNATPGSCVIEAQKRGDSSWDRPLIQDIPEGVRLLSVLAAGRRSSIVEFCGDSNEDAQARTITLPGEITNFVNRWRRFESGKVFVSEHSISAAAIPAAKLSPIFACCATTLHLKNGGIRVENLTLLPQGSQFLKLALLSFGLDDHSCFKIDDEDEETSKDNIADERFELAKAFSKSCFSLGEKLVCFPDKVRTLCQIFDGVDGHPTVPWKGLKENMLCTNSVKSGKKRKNKVARRNYSKNDVQNPNFSSSDLHDAEELVNRWMTSDKQ